MITLSERKVNESECVSVQKRENRVRDKEFDDGNANMQGNLLGTLKIHTKYVPRLVQHLTYCDNNLCVNGFKL